MRRERLQVAVLALIATYAFFYEYLPPFKHVHLWSDIEGYHYPIQRYAFQAFKEGRIPLWDASIYCGIPFAGNVQAALFYPPTWLMYAAVWRLPRIPFKALEVFSFFHVWLAFMLCYLWLRGRTGKLAAVLGAAVFAYTGYMLREIGHTGVICAMAWMPLGLWGIDEASRRDWRPLWKVAAASTLSFLAGYPSAWLVFIMLAAVYALATHWRTAAGVCVAIAFSTLLAAAQLLPTLEAASMMVREPKYGPPEFGPAVLILSYFLPNWFDFNPGHPTGFDPVGTYFYLGLPALFAVAWALWRRHSRPYLQPFAGLAAALVLANPPLFLIHAVERIPTLDHTIQTHNFYAAVALMAALITALSLDDFLQARRTATTNLPAWTVALAVAVLVIWPARQLWIWTHGGAFAVGARSLAGTAIAAGLFFFGIWAVRAASGRRRILLTAALLLTTGVDYKAFGSSRWFNAVRGDVDDYHIPYGIAGIDDESYRAMWANRQYRVFTYGGIGPAPTDFRLWGLATPTGFDPFLPRQYKEVIEHWVPFRTNRLFDLDPHDDNMLQSLGVRFALVLTGTPSDELLAGNRNFSLVGSKDIFCHVYEYLRAAPPYRWESAEDGTATPTVWIPERREFGVRSERGGRFVLVEQFFPGWRAKVDGREVRIERWGGAFQAIAVGPGSHRVAFEYRPRSWWIGVGLSVVAVTVLAGLVLARLRGTVTGCVAERP